MKNEQQQKRNYLLEFAQASINANWDPDAYPEPQGNDPVIEPERDAQGHIID